MPDIYMDVDAALAEVPVNMFPLLDDTDFKTLETGVAYNAAGLSLVWNFVTTAGAFTQTAVTPTTGGSYDWASQGSAMYTIEVPASGGASVNNDTEGFGWFSGVATGILPWRGPVIGFRAAGLNNSLIDSAYSATQGLAGTNLDAAVGLSATATALSVISTTIGTAGAGLTAVPWNASWDAEVQSEVDDALGAAITEPPNLAATKSVKFFLWSLWSRFFHRNTQTATAQVTYKADGATALATRTVSDDGTTQTVEAGS